MQNNELKQEENKIVKKIKSLPNDCLEFIKSNQGATILASILCVLIGLVIGLIILVIIEPAYGFTGFIDILTGAFATDSSTAIAYSNAAALILVGLAVTFAFKCGLFNIGVAGQFLMGIVGCLAPALIFGWHWIICLICGGLLGALWGVIPALLKTFCNVNEVISGIMTNWIALYLVNDIIKSNTQMYDNSILHTHYTSGISTIPTWFTVGSSSMAKVSFGLLVAILISISVYVLLNKTKFGYEIRACGLNKDAAKYAGINHRKNILFAMGFAGFFAGCAAGVYYLSNAGQYNPNVSSVLPQMGFDGISVALIGALNPIGGIFSALLLAFLTRGSTTISTTYFPVEMATLIFGIIIYLCAFNEFFRDKISGFLNKVKKTKPEASNIEVSDKKVGDE